MKTLLATENPEQPYQSHNTGLYHNFLFTSVRDPAYPALHFPELGFHKKFSSKMRVLNTLYTKSKMHLRESAISFLSKGNDPFLLNFTTAVF